MTDVELTQNMVAFYGELGALPSIRVLENVLERLERLDVQVIAAMQGPTLLGDPRRSYCEALHGNPVAELVDAPHYSRRLEFGPSSS